MPQRHSEPQHEEFREGVADMTACPDCGNIFHDKKWNHAENVINTKKEKKINKRKVCPACRMVRSKQYEGEIIISGFPESMRQEVINLIKGFGEREEEMDSQNRIVSFSTTRGGYRVTTTDDQMAVRIGKKIRHAFNTVILDISYAAEPTKASKVTVSYFKG